MGYASKLTIQKVHFLVLSQKFNKDTCIISQAVIVSCLLAGTTGHTHNMQAQMKEVTVASLSASRVESCCARRREFSQPESKKAIYPLNTYLKLHNINIFVFHRMITCTNQYLVVYVIILH